LTPAVAAPDASRSFKPIAALTVFSLPAPQPKHARWNARHRLSYPAVASGEAVDHGWPVREAAGSNDLAGLRAAGEKHNGVWGGCWCMAFHARDPARTKSAALNRSEKERRVRDGQAHAALVYDGEAAVGWCQFGPTDELPRIKHGRAYREGLTALPDWRITCFFVDRDYRGKGVAAAALAGALTEIARLGGGAVESYPQAIEGRRVSGSFLYNATVSLFERHGFQRTRRLGKNHWVVTRRVSPA
jgi:GNAT superfamily N-acetyltransferase